MEFFGSWDVSVVGVKADWAQRVVVSGSVETVFPGRVGHQQTISGDRWRLHLEHDAGAGWRPNARVLADPPERRGNRITRILRSKDHDWVGDHVPDDLVLRLEGTRRAISIPAVQLSPTGDEGWRLTARVQSAGAESLGFSTGIRISDACRERLLRDRVEVLDQDRAGHVQERLGDLVVLPPLPPGESADVHFLLASAAAPSFEPAFEFVNAENDRVLQQVAGAGVSAPGAAERVVRSSWPNATASAGSPGWR